MDYTNCKLCPRQCGVDRTAGELGFCRCPDTALVAKAMIHQWEEPVLAGSGGSGAIFFSGCTLGCRYCQNRAISQSPAGRMADSKQLRMIMEELILQGAENIDLVTPTQFLPTVIPALQPKLPVPVVYNCGGYEKPETVKKIGELVDIWLPDMKYADNTLAFQLSGVNDYFEIAAAAICQMVKQTGKIQQKNGKLQKGVLIRHLILPGQVENSLKVLDWIGETFAPGEVLVSLMRQYTPMPGMTPPLDRAVTEEEYQAVLSWMYLNGLEGFTQESDSAKDSFIPDFQISI